MRQLKKPHKYSFVSFFSDIMRFGVKTTRIGDWIIGMFITILILLIIIFLNKTSNTMPYVKITAQNNTFLYDLQTPNTITIEGPVGQTIITINNNQVDVLESPGYKQICVNAAPISQNGQWLACLPNQVFIRIHGKNKKENPIDGVSF